MTAALIIASGKRSDKDALLPDRKVASISAIRRIAPAVPASLDQKIVVCGEDLS